MWKRNLPKIRAFAATLLSPIDPKNNELLPKWMPCATWMYGDGELHIYCSNYKDHQPIDYSATYDCNRVAMQAEFGYSERDALKRIRLWGWIISQKHGVCICPACAKKHGLIECVEKKKTANAAV